MPDKILHKRSLTPGAVPGTGSLELCELAINVADGKVHLRRSGSSNDVVSLVTANTETIGSITATSFSGSFSGSGVNLSGIPASGIVGLNLSQIATGSITAAVNVDSASFAITSGSSTFLFVNNTGNVGVNTTSLPYSKVEIQTISADESYILGGELTTSASGANWLGTSFATGFTHTPGSTAALTATSLTIAASTFYYVDYTITGNTTGSVTIDIGGVSSGAVSSSGNFFRRTTSTSTLTVTPTSNFNGTVVISVKALVMLGSLSEELLTTGTGTGWSGTSYATGYTHTTGTTALTAQNLNINDYNFYILSWTVTNRTSGSFYVVFGNHPVYNITTSWSNALFGPTVGDFRIVPTTDFNGTITVSAKRVNPTKPHISVKSSSGSLLADVKLHPYDPTNLSIGYEAGLNLANGYSNTFIGYKAGKQFLDSFKNTIIGSSADYPFQQDRQLGVNASRNTLIGADVPVPIGGRNVLIGTEILSGGNGNLQSSVIIGSYTAVNINAGSGNVIIGIGASTNSTGGGGTNVTAIGANAVNLGSNTTNIGAPSATWANIYGNLTLGTTTSSSFSRMMVLSSDSTTASYAATFRNSNNANILAIRGDGSVGINRIPTSSLDVAGTTRLSGSFNTATSGSILTVIGSGSAQPIFTVQGSQGELFSVVDSLSGSLFSVNDVSGLPIMEVFSDNSIVMGNYLDPMLITTVYTGSVASGSHILYRLPTSSYDGFWFEYTVRSGSNARAGQMMGIWSGTSVNYTETTTTDFGTTTGINLMSAITGSNMIISASTSTTGWTIKGIVRAI